MRAVGRTAILVAYVALVAPGCSGAEKEVEKPTLVELLKGLELSEGDLRQADELNTIHYGPRPPVDPKVIERRKVVRQALARRLHLNREVTRIGGEGQLDVADVIKSFRRHRARVTRCYEIALKDASGLHGRVGVRFTVNTNGRIQDVTVTENTTQSGPLAGCLAQQLTRIRTSKAKGGVAEFTWSVDLSPPETVTERR